MLIFLASIIGMAYHLDFKPFVVIKVETTARFVVTERIWLEPCRPNSLLTIIKVIHDNAGSSEATFVD